MSSVVPRKTSAGVRQHRILLYRLSAATASQSHQTEGVHRLGGRAIAGSSGRSRLRNHPSGFGPSNVSSVRRTLGPSATKRGPGLDHSLAVVNKHPPSNARRRGPPPAGPRFLVAFGQFLPHLSIEEILPATPLAGGFVTDPDSRAVGEIVE